MSAQQTSDRSQAPAQVDAALERKILESFQTAVSSYAGVEPRMIATRVGNKTVNVAAYEFHPGEEVGLEKTPSKLDKKDTLVFVCGRGETYELYSRLIAENVAEGRRVVIIEPPGQGSSDRFWDGDVLPANKFLELGITETTHHIPNGDLLTKPVRQVIEQYAENGSNYILGAHSTGGAIVMQALRQMRREDTLGNLAGTLYLSPYVEFDEPGLGARSELAAIATSIRTLLGKGQEPARGKYDNLNKTGADFLTVSDLETVRDFVAKMENKRDFPRTGPAANSWVAAAGRVTLYNRISKLLANSSEEVGKRIGEISADDLPNLVLYTRDDQIVGVGRFEEIFPKEELEAFDGRHQLYLSQGAEEVHARTQSFVKEVFGSTRESGLS